MNIFLSNSFKYQSFQSYLERFEEGWGDERKLNFFIHTKEISFFLIILTISKGSTESMHNICYEEIEHIWSLEILQDSPTLRILVPEGLPALYELLYWNLYGIEIHCYPDFTCDIIFSKAITSCP